MGKLGIDDDSAGQQRLAHRLGWPRRPSPLSVEGGTVTSAGVDRGKNHRRDLRCDQRGHKHKQPRLPKLPDIMKAEKPEVLTGWTLAASGDPGGALAVPAARASSRSSRRRRRYVDRKAATKPRCSDQTIDLQCVGMVNHEDWIIDCMGLSPWRSMRTQKGRAQPAPEQADQPEPVAEPAAAGAQRETNPGDVAEEAQQAATESMASTEPTVT